MMKDLILLDYIGFFGPIIIILIVAFNLWNQPKYLLVYSLSVIFNLYINKVLKIFIREPRPHGQIHIMDFEEKAMKNADTYGMPSSHAQSAFFPIVFLYLVKPNSVYLLIGLLFIAALTVLQRYKYKAHTAKQLLVGSLTGVLIGYFVIYVTNYYLIKEKYL